jgi:twitching motility two-component system response regulator PilH
MGIFSTIRSIFDHEPAAQAEAQDSGEELQNPSFPGDRRRVRRHNPRPGTRVLVVDDSQTVVVALSRFLASVECEVITASDAKAGLQMALTKKPNLIFLDIVMPGINGFAALRALRRNASTWKIPVIMMSGNEQATAQFFGINIGADDFMKKPFSRQEVFNRISRLLDEDGVPRRENLAPGMMPAAAPASVASVPAAPAPVQAPAAAPVAPAAPAMAAVPSSDVHVHVHVEAPAEPARPAAAAPSPIRAPAYLRSEEVEPQQLAGGFSLDPHNAQVLAHAPAHSAAVSPPVPGGARSASSHELLMQIAHWAPLAMSDAEALSILKPLMRRFLELYDERSQEAPPAMPLMPKLTLVEA